MDVCIIGAGASALVCAIRLKNNNKQYNVTILEKNMSPLKKLLLTGNGKCNYFNSDMSTNHYRSTDNVLLSEIITNENVNKALDFFDEIGVFPKIKNGYYYPFSGTSTTIKNLLLIEAERLGVVIKTNTLVTDIIHNDKFILKTNNKDYVCDKLVIATGSNASIKNEEYNMYSILNKLGHKIIDPLPALVMLEGNEKYFNDWAGIRSDVVVSLYEDNKFIASEEGEIQLTNYGLSGICVMNLSGRVARGLSLKKKEEIKINFMPMCDNVYEFINERSNTHKNLSIIELLESIINYKLLYVILKKNNINTTNTWIELSSKEKEKIVNDLSNFSLNITSTKGVEVAQVINGGVSLKEINSDFSSKIINNLYLIGEVLDVDGDCGGYNLAFAWISGLIAGDKI